MYNFDSQEFLSLLPSLGTRNRSWGVDRVFPSVCFLSLETSLRGAFLRTQPLHERRHGSLSMAKFHGGNLRKAKTQRAGGNFIPLVAYDPTTPLNSIIPVRISLPLQLLVPRCNFTPYCSHPFNDTFFCHFFKGIAPTMHGYVGG